MSAVASKLLMLSSELDADVSLVARTAAVEGKLLLLPPAEVKQRLMAVKQVQAVIRFHSLLATKMHQIIDSFGHPIFKNKNFSLLYVLHA
jgi:hypothetical protein